MKQLYFIFVVVLCMATGCGSKKDASGDSDQHIFQIDSVDRVHEAVIAAAEKESGITIHFINGHYDEGDTIFQATCPVMPNDTPETLAARVHALEYEHFPQVIEKILM